MSKRIAVLCSGGGTNLQALIDAVEAGSIDGEIVLVLANASKAFALERARRHGIPAEFISKKQAGSDEAFNDVILQRLRAVNADLVVLAGYLPIVGRQIVRAFEHRIINIHPALLPSFRGLHAQRQAIEAGVKVAGCTVHFVGTGLDDGPIITQTAVPVYDDDTEDTLSARILEQEHPSYVRAVAAYCRDELTIEGHHVSGMHGHH